MHSNPLAYDIDHVGDANAKQRGRDGMSAEDLTEDKVQQMLPGLASRHLAPTIVALEERLNGIREVEAKRFRHRLSTLSTEQRDAVDAITRGILSKIFHGAIIELERVAEVPGQSAPADLTRKIFGLGSPEEAQRSI